MKEEMKITCIMMKYHSSETEAQLCLELIICL